METIKEMNNKDINGDLFVVTSVANKELLSTKGTGRGVDCISEMIRSAKQSFGINIKIEQVMDTLGSMVRTANELKDVLADDMFKPVTGKEEVIGDDNFLIKEELKKYKGSGDAGEMRVVNLVNEIVEKIGGDDVLNTINTELDKVIHLSAKLKNAYENYLKKRTPKTGNKPSATQETEPESTYAGRDPEFSIGDMKLTDNGKMIKIISYDTDKGLYTVMDLDMPLSEEVTFPISPDKLGPIE